MIKYNTIDQGKICKTMLGHGGFINESLYICSGNHVRILHMIYPRKKSLYFVEISCTYFIHDIPLEKVRSAHGFVM